MIQVKKYLLLEKLTQLLFNSSSHYEIRVFKGDFPLEVPMINIRNI